MAKLDFEIKLEEGLTVKEAASSVTLNGKSLDASTISIYKIEDADYNYCYLFDLNALSSDYVIKKDEIYGIGVKDFSYEGIDVTFQSEEEIAINGKYVEEYEEYCFGTTSSIKNTNNMRVKMMAIPSTTTTVTTDTTTTTTEVTDTKETTVIEPKPTEKDNNVANYVIVGCFLLLLVALLVLYSKIKNKSEVKES